mgnify:CR=1 FL=1
MSSNKLLNTSEYSSKSQIYDDLLSEGIDWIQKFSGDTWTDYNYHDPGITILEQLCYAITDLGYKSNFSAEDILLMGTDKFDFKKNNLFYSLDEILESSPNTINDIRKLIIDSIDEVNNVWLDTCGNSEINLNGLFNVRLQLANNLNVNKIDEIVSRTRKILMKNRSLCSDLKDVIILEKKIIGFSANIHIESFCVAEDILARIMFLIEKKLNEKVKVLGYEYLEDNDVNNVDIFSGVRTHNGLILDKNLKEKTNQIFVSEILEIIKKIDGVVDVKDFKIFNDGIRVFDDIITFPEDSYPQLESIDNLFSEDFLYEIDFIRNNSKALIDTLIFSQVYDSLVSEHNHVIFNKNFIHREIKGRFNYNSISKYYPIINEFPSVYGLREKELDPKSEESRIAKMKQLKVYLLIFDQILSSYLSQLCNIRNLFSVNNKERTYFNQIPQNIFKIDELVSAQNQKEFLDKINLISEDYEKFFQRKNKFLDHMLSRFGEFFDSDLIKNTRSFNNFPENKFQEDLKALDSKMTYANNILSLGRSRNLAFDYSSFKKNISGLEKRLLFLLDIKKEISSPNIDFDVSDFKIVQKNIWSEKEIIHNNKSIKVLSLPPSCYNLEKFNFYLSNYSTYKELFINGINKKSYKIIKSDSKYFVLYNSNHTKIPVKVFSSKSRESCELKLKDFFKKINKVDVDNEGFFMVEHILLRPMDVKKYFINVDDESGKTIFKSDLKTDYKYLTNIRDNLVDLLKNSRNYSIQPSKANKNLFKVVVYDTFDVKLLSHSKNFKTKNSANLFIKKSLKYHKKFKINILSKNVYQNQFPENFNYSNEISFFIPEWPSRFQDIEFKRYINDLIDFYIPANINFNIFYLNYFDMKIFSESYSKWLKIISNKNNSKIDIISLEIIQSILKFKNA